MKRNILQIIGIYLCLTIVITFAMRDISIRHTLFLLVDAILLTAGGKLFVNYKCYYKALFFSLLVGCSLFVIRYLTPTVIKSWEVDTYFSFVFALANLFLLLVAIIPYRKVKGIIVYLCGFFIMIPLIFCWGYYVSENSWLNAEAVMAILQTNPAEALSYIKERTGIFAGVLVLVVLLIIHLWYKVTKSLILKKISKKLVACVVLLLVLNGILLVRTSDNFLINIYDEVKTFQANYDEYARQCKKRQEDINTEINLNNKGEDGVFVLVIGESQNRTRMSAYGYGLETTPWLKSMKDDKNMILFENVYSCHVQTAPSVTYALTAKNQYNDIQLKEAVSLIDVAKAAGFQTVWLSNQAIYGLYSTPISVIAESADQKIWLNAQRGEALDSDYYDEELVNKLDNINKTKKMLIVVHLMGNHIAYHSRYPAKFEKFSDEYDNSIFYNDYVMQKLLSRFNEWDDFKGLMYFSDHSEAVNFGESHNPSTFRFDMAYIPMYIYLTSSWQHNNYDKMNNLLQARDKVFTNDLVFNTMLGIMGISGEGLDEKQNDLTNIDYDNNINRFKTLYGKRFIKEDDGTGN